MFRERDQGIMLTAEEASGTMGGYGTASLLDLEWASRPVCGTSAAPKSCREV